MTEQAIHDLNQTLRSMFYLMSFTGGAIIGVLIMIFAALKDISKREK